LRVAQQLVRIDVPIMIGTAVLLWLLGADGRLSRGECAFLVVLLVAYTGFLLKLARRESATVQSEYQAAFAVPSARRRTGLDIALVLCGLGLLVLGGTWLVDGAVRVAQAAGLSETVIGLTIVAAGTSLPEVATSLIASFRGERDIAVGNVVGSNTFNLLGCLGASGLVAEGGLPVRGGAGNPDLWVMLAVAAACVPVCLTGRTISRREGALFALYYVAYATWLGWSAARGSTPPAWGIALLLLAPPALVLLAAAAPRPRGARG
jgi:cation:H+ antiporter